ncbi:SMI1/KNR4 family protein [Hymenobacter koreensis]
MKRNDWKTFKKKSEEKFEKIEVNYVNVWGFQEQKNTKWNTGLSTEEIKELEKHFGFSLPKDYYEMLKTINGFDKDHISINPDKKKTKENSKEDAINIQMI